MSSLPDITSHAARDFWRYVSDHVSLLRPWDPQIIHDVAPDEVNDPTLISQRVYGTRYEVLAVLASARVDVPDAPIPQTRIILPAVEDLRKIKRKSGYEGNPNYRRNGKPTWEA